MVSNLSASQVTKNGLFSKSEKSVTLSFMITTKKFLSESEDGELKTKLVAVKNRDTLMLHLLRTYGMRSSELLGLKKEDIGPESIVIRGTKNSNDREFPIPADIMERIKEQAQIVEGERVFPISGTMLRKIWYKYRTAKKGLHCLRHGVGVRTYQISKDIILTKQILGHKALSSTMVYQSYVYSTSEFKKVLLP